MPPTHESIGNRTAESKTIRKKWANCTNMSDGTVLTDWPRFAGDGGASECLTVTPIVPFHRRFMREGSESAMSCGLIRLAAIASALATVRRLFARRAVPRCPQLFSRRLIFQERDGIPLHAHSPAGQRTLVSTSGVRLAARCARFLPPAAATSRRKRRTSKACGSTSRATTNRRPIASSKRSPRTQNRRKATTTWPPRCTKRARSTVARATCSRPRTCTTSAWSAIRTTPSVTAAWPCCSTKRAGSRRRSSCSTTGRRASPKSPDPKIELARLLEEVGQDEQAKAQLVDALTIDPHNARALTALGRLRDQSGDHAQALANYQRSLSLNRFQPEVAARVAQLQGAVGAPVSRPHPPSRQPPPACSRRGGIRLCRRRLCSVL